jgi:hypothetical protein|tara:strand:+ start:1310 stop:1447 length:138 start_codon:yes stop_codon:yes gene_type:complete
MVALSYVVFAVVLIFACKKLVATRRLETDEEELDKLDELYLKGRR